MKPRDASTGIARVLAAAAAAAGCASSAGTSPLDAASPPPTVRDAATPSAPRDASILPADAAIDRCTRTHERVILEVTEDGVRSGCDTMTPGTGPDLPGPEGIEVRGQVTRATGDTVTLDRCSPAANCLAGTMLTSLRIAAPGLELERAVPLQAFVSARYRFQIASTGECRAQVRLARLPEWDGVPTPAAGDRDLYVAAGDADLDPLPGSEFTLSAVGQSCTPATTPDCIYLPDVYALDLASTRASVGGLMLRMGQADTFELTGQSGLATPYRARNLRSYVERCQGQGEWGWWLAAQPYIR